MQKNNRSYSSRVPFGVRAAKNLGIDQFLLRMIVFKKGQPKYQICRINNKNTIVINDQIYQPPISYAYEALILQQKQFSVPIFHLYPQNSKFKAGFSSEKKQNIFIVYAHGNCSDLSDSIDFLQKISYQFIPELQSTACSRFNVNFVAFDYTGYGQSKFTNANINEETICIDLEMVLSWIVQTKLVPFQNIILWGFSLGAYPVCYCSQMYPVRACILQSPFASILQFFNINQDEEDGEYLEDEVQDYLSNLKFIGKINCQILLLHSRQDEIIPFSHSEQLLKRYKQKNLNEKLEFIEVTKLRHNQMHQYICSLIDNPLRKKFQQFLAKILSNFVSNSSSTKTISNSSSLISFHHLKSCRYESQSKLKEGGSLDYSQKLRDLYKDLEEAKIQEETQLQLQFQFQNGIKKSKIKNFGKNRRKLSCFCIENC